MKKLRLRLKQRLGRILHSFRFTMIGAVFLIMLTAGTLASLIVSSVYLISPDLILERRPLFLTMLFFPVSVLLGTVLSVVVSKLILRPVDDLIGATHEVSRGNFDIEVPIRYEKNEFSRLINAFNSMTRELSGIEIFRNDFINNFSHEFKTPLNSIRGFARELCAPGLTEEERNEYIGIIIAACDRLSGMASSVLLLSKLENQQFITERAEHDIPEQIRDVILMLEKQWTKKGIELDLELDERIHYSCNAETLSHVWQNLLSNAIKYCPEEGGIIKVSCSEEPFEGISISIADNGSGISPEALPHIFEKFYQGDTSHKADGNGLGLALVRRIVELYGGTIEVESQVGRGSRFTVRLPRSV